jgi:putative membrane protein
LSTISYVLQEVHGHDVRSGAVIHRYGDHAANERTFLAWIRTAVAVMAFGFLVERFDFFLEVAARSVPAQAPSQSGRLVGDIAGLLLILLAGGMMVIATLRFLQTTKDIDAAEARPAKGKRLDVAVVVLLIGLGGTLFAYLVYTVLRRMG